MKLIIGLGNPERKYAQNRHNIGFMTVDALGEDRGQSITKKKFNALYEKISLQGEELILLKPQTYMNLSGKSVQAAATFFKVKLEDILVIHDELDLPFGTFRYKQGGGYAGHNGLKSIGAMMGGNGYARIRVGIGRPEGGRSCADYVLSDFDGYEQEVLSDRLIPEVIDSVRYFLENGILKTMNQYH